MALREIRVQGDPILEKTCRPVEKLTPRLESLILDMFETMEAAEGVGLAAPQVGVLRQIAVVNIDLEKDRSKGYVLINPEILETEGEQTGDEGCLSVPGKVGTVTRPAKVRVRAYDIHMQPFELEAEDLLARALCHEIDHLRGVVYTSLAEGPLRDNWSEEEPEEEMEGDSEA